MGKADLSLLSSTTPGTRSHSRADTMRMTFVSNHDKNAWEGTEFEQFGDALEAAIVLSVSRRGHAADL